MTVQGAENIAKIILPP